MLAMSIRYPLALYCFIVTLYETMLGEKCDTLRFCYGEMTGCNMSLIRVADYTD